MYGDGDDALRAEEPALAMAAAFCALLLVLLDFFSLRPLPLASPPLFWRADDDDDDADAALLAAADMAPRPPGNAAANSAGCGNADKPDACKRVK